MEKSETFRTLDHLDQLDLIPFIERISIVETRLEDLMLRHNQTEGIFVQMVILGIVGLAAIAFLVIKKND